MLHSRNLAPFRFYLSTLCYPLLKVLRPHSYWLGLFILWSGAGNLQASSQNIKVKFSSCRSSSCTFISSKENLPSWVKRDAPVVITHKNRVVYQGDLQRVKSNKDRNAKAFRIKGRWLVASDAQLPRHLYLEPQLVETTAPNETEDTNVSEISEKSEKEKDSKAPSPFARRIKFRNDVNRALVSIVGKAGAPLASTSGYGAALEWNQNGYMPYEVHFGSFSSPAAVNGEEKQSAKSMTSFGIGTSLLLGGRGSYLKIGSGLTYYNLEQNGETNSYFALVPTIGLRVESDAEMIFSFEMSTNLSFVGDLSGDLGEAKSDVGLFNGSGADICLGLGFGI